RGALEDPGQDLEGLRGALAVRGLRRTARALPGAGRRDRRARPRRAARRVDREPPGGGHAPAHPAAAACRRAVRRRGPPRLGGRPRRRRVRGARPDRRRDHAPAPGVQRGHGARGPAGRPPRRRRSPRGWRPGDPALAPPYRGRSAPRPRAPRGRVLARTLRHRPPIHGRGHRRGSTLPRPGTGRRRRGFRGRNAPRARRPAGPAAPGRGGPRHRRHRPARARHRAGAPLRADPPRPARARHGPARTQHTRGAARDRAPGVRPLIQPALYAALAGLTNLLGGILVTAGVRGRTGALNVLVAFGAGFMLAVALLEMLPGAMETAGGLTAVLAGYLAVHLTQHTLTPHFHFG